MEQNSKIYVKAKRLVALLLAASLALGFIPNETRVYAAKKMTLNKKSVTLKVGATTKLKVKNVKKKVAWKSSNKKVAKVDKNGKVTAVKKGKARITAKVSGKKLICKVQVTTQVQATSQVQATTTTQAQVTTAIQPATETPTTSAPVITTETPATETPSTKTPTNYSKYKIEKININSYEYNVTRDINFSQEVLSKSNNSDCINLNIENKYTRMVVDAREGLLENYGYLKYLGKITATDKNGADISDRIVVRDSFFYPLKDNEYSYNALVCIYVEDNFGNSYTYKLRIFNIDDVDDYSDAPGYEKIEDGKVKLYVTKDNSIE